ncbi:hypothetical protein [Maribacter halichondriae]|uniref:hypothetical protein n=1 Tax=Maribacter halichondriae TaxID=2980554 RepID=UPI002359C3BD|nr:hypothetical protein [Maribacter sp. Hal144]
MESQTAFNISLSILAFFSKRNLFNGLTQWATNQLARLTIFLNKPNIANNVEELATIWQELMPEDGREYFKIGEIKKNTAYTEIHLQCPLRGTGNVEACNKLMNYDRKLMNAAGGTLIVLESQSNSGKNYCRLAIRKEGLDTSDLIPANKKGKVNQNKTTTR